MVKKTFNSVQEIKDSIGTQLGPTDWVEITQEDVNAFADVTGDHQWIHIDVERAKQSDFGGTIVHGFMSLAFLPRFGGELYEFDLGSAKLNYGLEKVRFLAQLPVGERIRASAEVVAVVEQASGTRVNTKWTIEKENGDRPICVAESVTLIIS